MIRFKASSFEIYDSDVVVGCKSDRSLEGEGLGGLAYAKDWRWWQW